MRKRVELLNKEVQEIARWYIEAIEALEEQLRGAGELKGLDGNCEAYRPVHAELNKRLSALLNKYRDLPRDTKVSLKAD